MSDLFQSAGLEKEAPRPLADRLRPKTLDEVVGQTPLEYITAWRMQLGKRLLRETRLSLEQIASRVGYESSASFSRVFTRQVGERPGAYRRRLTEQANAG